MRLSRHCLEAGWTRSCCVCVSIGRYSAEPVDFVFAHLSAAELADCGPRPGGQFGSIKTSVGGHVGAQGMPGGFILRVHAEACPDVLGHLGGLFAGESLVYPVT